MRRKESVSKKAVKVAFYGAAAFVGVLLAVSAVRKKGKIIKEEGGKMIKKTRNSVKGVKDNLNDRQRRILKLFDKEDKITNDMITSVITGVTRRTIRRDLDFLEDHGYIKQVGKTKGSYYVLR